MASDTERSLTGYTLSNSNDNVPVKTKAATDVYSPISLYQTRVIILDGDDGASESPLVCTLYPVDILHPHFGGLGLRSPPARDASIIEYEALSYTWGSQGNSAQITCNGVQLAVTRNLFDALMALRRTRKLRRYLWVDAICINQSDKMERAQQVRNMLMIYQNAMRVIAWLGSPHENTEDLLIAAASINNYRPADLDFFWKVHAGMQDLYTRPWFRRLWVQQEIYAAQELRLQCGHVMFRWDKALSNPEFPATVLCKRPPKHVVQYTEKSKTISAEGHAILHLEQLHTANLTCFERFSTRKSPQLNFLDTLLYTGTLNSTDQRDYIYGILGTGFAASRAAHTDCDPARLSEAFIPIDYSAGLNSILTAVTWVALMKGGLGVLAKFKVFITSAPGNSEQPLPTWAVDWRLAAKLFRRRSPDDIWTYTQWFSDPKDTDEFSIKIENAWDIRVARYSERVPWRGTLVRKIPRERISGPRPVEHEQFCKDNRDGKLPFTKICLRGVVLTNYVVRGKRIWEERKPFNRLCWQLPVDVDPAETDIIVYMLGFVGAGYRGLSPRDYDHKSEETYRHRSGGLWLLRPAGNDEFKLVACLSWLEADDRPLYDHWLWRQERQISQYRRLAINPERKGCTVPQHIKAANS